MYLKSLTPAAALGLGVIFLAACSGGGPNGAVQFQAHDIAEFSGYAVAVADFNNDGRLDVIANSLGVPEVAWHENPTWERHVIVTDNEPPSALSDGAQSITPAVFVETMAQCRKVAGALDREMD